MFHFDRLPPARIDLLYSDGPVSPASINLEQALGLQSQPTVIDAEDPARTRVYSPAPSKLDRTPPPVEPKKTQAVETVPRTDAASMKLATDERPKVVVEDPTTFSASQSRRDLSRSAEPEPPARRIAFARLWPWIAIGIGIAGFAVGLASLLRG